MIEITNVGVYGFTHAMRIMRLPLESGNKSDSCYVNKYIHKLPVKKLDLMADNYGSWFFQIGSKDMELSKKLYKSGCDHSKHLDHIMVQCIITGPRYWLAELMTYSTVPARPVSGSTMHNLLKRPATIEDFEAEYLSEIELESLNSTIEAVNQAIENSDLKAAKALLPESYKQTRGFTFNFTNLANIYRQRKNHRLKEWKDFCKWIEDLPYSELIIDKEE